MSSTQRDLLRTIMDSLTEAQRLVNRTVLTPDAIIAIGTQISQANNAAQQLKGYSAAKWEEKREARQGDLSPTKTLRERCRSEND